jgi:drug/metabolite transporter (DMT)-like permease
MKIIGNLLAVLGLLMFAYTTVARFLGEKSIAGFTQIPLLGKGFTAVGSYAATACVLLLAAIALMKSKE